MAGHRARGREGRDAEPPSRPRIYGALSGAVADPEAAASRTLRRRAVGPFGRRFRLGDRRAFPGAGA